MYNRKPVKSFVLLIALCLLTSCSSTYNESAVTTTIMVASDTSAHGTADTALPVGIMYTTDKDGRTIATGATPEGIPVSAVILANRDLRDPGEASSYVIQTTSFSEEHRSSFVGQDWTMIESSSVEDYEGTIYYDVYCDAQKRQWNVDVFATQVNVYTARGLLFYSFLYCSSAQPEEQADFSFTSTVEAYQEAKDFLSIAGFNISDCYYIYRYPSIWLENSAKLARLYGNDMTEYDRLYPNGLSPEDGVYILDLRLDINGLPILTGEIGRLLVDGQVPLEKNEEKSINSFTKAIVTNQGLEFAMMLSDFLVGDVIETGSIVSFEEALHTVSQNFFSGNPNDGLYKFIYQNCMRDLSANMEETITPVITESYQPVSGAVSIERAELGLLPIAKGEEGTGRAIPCWEFLFVWQSDPNDPQSAKSECWAAVNALTGEYIPATTVTQEDIG